ncbi:MAG: UvrD-helicase domain-containing protein [Myxococcota bacterium]
MKSYFVKSVPVVSPVEPSEEQCEQLCRQLNEEQRDVVLAPYDQPLLVVAGAGSGKTRALTHRVAFLVQQGLPIERIMLCTFTNKAAHEMVGRVEQLLQCRLDSMWAGTFHHLCHRLLRRHAHLLGFSPGFTILDREDATTMLDQIIRSHGFPDEYERFPKGRVFAEMLAKVRRCKSDFLC